MKKIGKEVSYLFLTEAEAKRVVAEAMKHERGFFWPKLGAEVETKFWPLVFWHVQGDIGVDGGVLLCEALSQAKNGTKTKTLVWRLIEVESCETCGSMRQDVSPLEWIAISKERLPSSNNKRKEIKYEGVQQHRSSG